MATYSVYSPFVSPTTSLRDDLIYVDTAPPSVHTPSPKTPSSVSTISVLSPSSIGSRHWSSMSHVSRSHTVTELDVEQIVRHPAYYIPSGDVVFLAGTQLFRVHRYFFVRESVKFRDMLSVVSSSGTELMGSSDSRAIQLSDVSKEEFESFLWVFYNDEYEYEATVERWSAILRLAHMWQFPRVKDLAIRKMDKLFIPPVDKAVMAREYEVEPALGWLEQAFAALGARQDPITKGEGVRLGLDVVLQLAELRERIRKRRFEDEKNVIATQSVGGASPIEYPPSPILESCRSPVRPRLSPHPYESPRARTPTLPHTTDPIQIEPTAIHATPNDPFAYSEEDLEDARSIFGL